MFNLLAAVNEIIEAYVKSTSSLNPPVFLKASMIWLFTRIAFETFANSLRIKSVVFIIASSYEFVTSISTPSQSKIIASTSFNDKVSST